MREASFILYIKFEEKPRALLDLQNALAEKLDELCASEKIFDYRIEFYGVEDYVVVDWAEPESKEAEEDE